MSALMDVVGSLRFVESERRYSLYVDEVGEEFYIAHGPGFRRLVTLDDLDIPALHREWESNYRNRHGEFASWIGVMLIDEWEFADNYTMCADCSEPANSNYTTYLDGRDESICDSCLGDYSECPDCSTYAASGDMHSTLHGEEVCEQCLNYNYSHCEECDGYYHGDYSGDHDHDCGCDSPEQTFTMPFVGKDRVTHEVITRVETPSGVISKEGMIEVRNILIAEAHRIDSAHGMEDEYYNSDEYKMNLALVSVGYRIEDEVGPEWQNGGGNFTKRLSRLLYKNYGVKIDPAMMSKIGNAARAHAGSGARNVQFTRDLNQSAEFFCHEDSCWWQSYGSSRCALKSCGGMAMLSYANESDMWPEGRAWVMPLKEGKATTWMGTEIDALVPTFDTESPAAWIVFNGYGDLEGYAPARILSQMTGMSYRKISLGAEPMYINGGSAYLISSEEISARYENSTLNLRVDEHSNLHHTERVMAHA